jgi:hypothetical protein
MPKAFPKEFRQDVIRVYRAWDASMAQVADAAVSTRIASAHGARPPAGCRTLMDRPPPARRVRIGDARIIRL